MTEAEQTLMTNVILGIATRYDFISVSNDYMTLLQFFKDNEHILKDFSFSLSSNEHFFDIDSPFTQGVLLGGQYRINSMRNSLLVGDIMDSDGKYI